MVSQGRGALMSADRWIQFLVGVLESPLESQMTRDTNMVLFRQRAISINSLCLGIPDDVKLPVVKILL